MATPEDIAYVRNLVSDRDSANLLITDEEMAAVIDRNSLNMAIAVAWSIKAGRVAHLIDIEESGSKRRLQQKFANAQKMAAFWVSIAGVSDAAIAAAIRVAGIAVNPYKSTLTPPVPISIAVTQGATQIIVDPAV